MTTQKKDLVAAERTNLSITCGPWATLVANRPWVGALTLGEKPSGFKCPIDKTSRDLGVVSKSTALREQTFRFQVPPGQNGSQTDVLRGSHRAVRENLQISGVHLPKLLAQSVCIETTPLARQTFRLQAGLCKTEGQTMFV